MLSYDFWVDWGDGTLIENFTGGNPSHIYAYPGTYEVQVVGVFPHFNLGKGTRENAAKLISIDQWGDIVWEDMSGYVSRGEQYATTCN